VAAAAAKNFFNFLLAIFGTIVHSRENYRACAKKNLSGALNQNKKT
jgi:hypothetical protein